MELNSVFKELKSSRLLPHFYNVEQSLPLMQIHTFNIGNI